MHVQGNRYIINGYSLHNYQHISAAIPPRPPSHLSPLAKVMKFTRLLHNRSTTKASCLKTWFSPIVSQPQGSHLQFQLLPDLAPFLPQLLPHVTCFPPTVICFPLTVPQLLLSVEVPWFLLSVGVPQFSSSLQFSQPSYSPHQYPPKPNISVYYYNHFSILLLANEWFVLCWFMVCICLQVCKKMKKSLCHTIYIPVNWPAVSISTGIAYQS